MEAPSVGTHSLVLYINHTFIVDCSQKNSKLKIFQYLLYYVRIADAFLFPRIQHG